MLADAAYGANVNFRNGLTARKLAWAVGIPRHLKVYRADVKMIQPPARKGGGERRLPVPDTPAIAAEDMLAKGAWRTICWRTGTKGKLKAHFAAVRIRPADGPARRRGNILRHLPGQEVWLIGERRSSGETKYHLSNLPIKTSLRRLAKTIKERWLCEQGHQQLKEELGLDHFEGRSWQGLHRHALMTMLAYAFLQHRRLASAKRKKKNRGPSAAAKPVRSSARNSRAPRPITASALSALPQVDMQAAAA
jgi:SRSO17 transposase